VGNPAPLSNLLRHTPTQQYLILTQLVVAEPAIEQRLEVARLELSRARVLRNRRRIVAALAMRQAACMMILRTLGGKGKRHTPAVSGPALGANKLTRANAGGTEPVTPIITYLTPMDAECRVSHDRRTHAHRSLVRPSVVPLRDGVNTDLVHTDVP
jgi:hypothetical protein